MAVDQLKTVLLGRTAEQLRAVHDSALNTMLAPDVRRANVIGLALGIKWTGGQPTGEPAVLVLVTHKADPQTIRPRDRVPTVVDGVKTDVLAVGRPMAGAVTSGSPDQTLTRRIRPVKGGYSVGHKDITAGTVATAVYDMLPGSTISPPGSGTGVPQHYYILSNNHILANGNAAAIGDAILQPGPYDGGTLPDDQIATLSRFVPIAFAPDVPVEQHNNIVDAAVAMTSIADVDRELHWVGRVRGWRPKANVNVGTVVQKVGRSSGFTTGMITAVNATIDIGYGGNKMARLQDQILTTPMSSPGDSGSLVATMDGVAVGLLCAGSPASMVANQIENVRSQLWVEVAEQVL